MQTQRDGKAEYERLRDLYPRDIGRRISVADLLVRWGVDRLYLEHLACSGDLIPSWDGLPIDVDTNDTRGAFRVMVNVEGPGLKAHHLQTGGDSMVIGDLVAYRHLPDKATYWLPAILDWESQHPSILPKEGLGSESSKSEENWNATTPLPTTTQAGHDLSQMTNFHQKLYAIWKEERRLGGTRFFRRLCHMKKVKDSPVREYSLGDDGTGPSVTLVLDLKERTITKRTIENLVCRFRKIYRSEQPENMSSSFSD